MRHTVLAMILASCSNSAPTSTVSVPATFDPTKPYVPQVTAAELSPNVTNPLLPFPVGARWVYESQTDEGLERAEIVVEAGTKSVWGTNARVVHDTVFLDGEMIEDTFDWYAQDSAGNVWYLGEDTHEYENGQVKSSAGSWTSGVDGALPGVVMLAQPKVGAVYRQEFYAAQAEDYADVESITATVDVHAGKHSGCLKTRDRSAIDGSIDEHKYYCPGIGNVLVEEGDVREELIEYSGL